MGNTLLQKSTCATAHRKACRVTFVFDMLRAVLVAVLALSTFAADAQQGRRQDDGRGRQMSREDRQRMRDDVRDAYRERERQDRDGSHRARQQQMSPEERGRLRRDIEDANRALKR
jgi:Ni/Co efflux regulator RcnB